MIWFIFKSGIPDPYCCSIEPDTMVELEYATDVTQCAWPSKIVRHSPVNAFQILTVLSQEPDTIQVPSKENATERTQSVWPCRD
ncbi:hypothetical protein GYMLUDRAFT_835713 [Collybiopsis luxurians FD-317 M1]|uniref:Uncharacterized protein n=1 Tax=Collybiopsis luxurians FD-317 M1 TaxID=944289 RepID=A0A0D0AYG1_9AGAR|nr:hypothetical protein GYMLUDRAFT_835713 [Collybiopsis luxurians FD-317 M1]